jgi:hypothetical protein
MAIFQVDASLASADIKNYALDSLGDSLEQSMAREPDTPKKPPTPPKPKWEGDPKFVVGDRVEARYRGLSQYYEGKIAAVNEDEDGFVGTYVVEYEDGEEVCVDLSTLMTRTDSQCMTTGNGSKRGPHPAGRRIR